MPKDKQDKLEEIVKKYLEKWKGFKIGATEIANLEKMLTEAFEAGRESALKDCQERIRMYFKDKQRCQSRRCKDFSPLCGCCSAWRAWNDLNELFKI